MKIQIDYYGKPKESLEALQQTYLGSTLEMEDVLRSQASYCDIYQGILDILKWGFEQKEIRTAPISFRFHPNDTQVHTLQIRHFLSNLILWKAFLDMDRVDVLDETFIYDFAHFNIDDLRENYLDKKIIPYHEGDSRSKNPMIDDICYAITAISKAFCMLMGMGISIYDIIQAEKGNPEIGEIIFSPLDCTQQPHEIEEELGKRTQRLMDLFRESQSDFQPLFRSGKILTPDQFKEILVRIGMRADPEGNTIPYPVDANLLVTGLNKPSYIYLDDVSGRKSLILTKLSMSEPGALSKKLNGNSTNVHLRPDFEECDSVAYVEYHINDLEFLQMLNGRTYYDERGNSHVLHWEEDQHLIGKRVPFSSPATCSSTNGICKKCYGELFDLNQDLASVGSFAATKLSEPIGQRVLKSKHYQATESGTIKFPDEFDNLFDLTTNEVSIRDDTESYDGELFLMFDEVKVEEVDDEDVFYAEGFRVVSPKKETIYQIVEEGGGRLYFSEQLTMFYKRLKDKTHPISLDKLDSELPIFFVEVANRELSEPIKVIQKLVNSKDKLGAETLSEYCQKFAEEYLRMGIRYDFVHMECIIRALLRKKSNILEFPDWSSMGDPSDYQLTRLNGALFNNPSALISLTSGDLRRQLISPELYHKQSPSYLDAVFVRDLGNYIDD